MRLALYSTDKTHTVHSQERNQQKNPDGIEKPLVYSLHLSIRVKYIISQLELLLFYLSFQFLYLRFALFLIFLLQHYRQPAITL